MSMLIPFPLGFLFLIHSGNSSLIETHTWRLLPLPQASVRERIHHNRKLVVLIAKNHSDPSAWYIGTGHRNARDYRYEHP